MALIHHPILKVNRNVPDRQVPIWTGKPGWIEGPGPWTVEDDPGFPPPGYDPDVEAFLDAEADPTPKSTPRTRKSKD